MACSGCSGAVERVLKKMDGKACGSWNANSLFAALLQFGKLMQLHLSHTSSTKGPCTQMRGISCCGWTPTDAANHRAHLPHSNVTHVSVVVYALFLTGVESYDVSLEQQRVVVRGNVTPEAVLATVSKTGKKAELVQ